MDTFVYLDKAGVKFAVYHRTATADWQHPYDERSICGACNGVSVAPPRPKEKP